MQQFRKCNQKCHFNNRCRRHSCPPGPSLSSLRRLLPHRNLFACFAFIFLLFAPANGQFGEIASVISSLVSNGAPAGLAGLGSAGSLGSLGASAGSAGAAGALSNIGPLYQLAQAALQLTGTGVGIANQASESAWFPVVVENAAKMHKDFQDRLLHGGGLGSTSRGVSTHGSSKNGGEELGTEYGKEFGSGESVAGTERSGAGLSGGTDPLSTLFGGPSRVSLLPPILPGFSGTTPATLGARGRPMLPGLAALLPGETPNNGQQVAQSKNEGEEGGGITMPRTGIGSVKEVPLSPPSFEHIPTAESPSAVGALLPGEVGVGMAETSTKDIVETKALPDLAPNSISSPKITVKLPDYDERMEGQREKGKKKGNKAIEQIETEFSTDRGNGGGTEGEEEDRNLEPLIPSGPSTQRLQRLNMTHIESQNNAGNEAESVGHGGGRSAELTHMVPELRNLVNQLKMGNLSVLELEELQNQLAENIEPGEPRENTEPPPTEASDDETGERAETGRNGGHRGRDWKAKNRVPNPKRELASNRNLEAFRKGIEESAEEEEAIGRKDGNREGSGGGGELELVDGHKDPILRKIVDFNHPPVILSLERPPQPVGPEWLTPFNRTIADQTTSENSVEGDEQTKQRNRRIEGGEESEAATADDDHRKSKKEGNEEIEEATTATETTMMTVGSTTAEEGKAEKSNKKLIGQPNSKATESDEKDKKAATLTEPAPHHSEAASSGDDQLPVVDATAEVEEQQQQPKERHSATLSAHLAQPAKSRTTHHTSAIFPQQSNEQFHRTPQQVFPTRRHPQPPNAQQQFVPNWQHQQQWNGGGWRQPQNWQNGPPIGNNYQQQLQHVQQQQHQLQYAPIQLQQGQQQSAFQAVSNLRNPNNGQQQQFNGPNRQFGQKQRTFQQPIPQQQQTQNGLARRDRDQQQRQQKAFNGRAHYQQQQQQRKGAASQHVQAVVHPSQLGSSSASALRTRFPARTIAPPPSHNTAPPSALPVQHPFSRGTLLTLAQPVR